MIQVWIIDNEGYLVESKFINESEKDDKCVLIGFETGFYKPKWDGSSWVEGATEEEIEKLNNQIECKPCLEERITELENVILSLL